MTQKQLIIDYCREFGFIIPAKMAGKIYKDTMFGSESSKRCREIRQDGYDGYFLESEPSDKFEKFYIKEKTNETFNKNWELKDVYRKTVDSRYTQEKFM